MTDELVIISPELKPGKGGVGDYTLRVLEFWSDQAGLKVLVPNRGLETSASFPFGTEPLATDPMTIAKQLPIERGKVLLQYSAYGYDRVGYPRKLLGALMEWKNRTQGRLVVVFHEIWTFWPILNKNALVQWFHRRSLKRLAQCADVVFTTTRDQAEHLQFGSGSSVHVLPVGSNIRPIKQFEARPRQAGQAVLFGLQPTRIRTLKRMKESLTNLAAAGRLSRIVTIGAGGSDGDVEEANQLGDLGLADGFEQRGFENEQAISQLLWSSAFGISDQDDLSYEKSGAFMAYTAHGLNILNQHADRTKHEPLCWLVRPDELIGGISEEELKGRAQRLRTWQERTASWDLIAAKLSDALGLQSQRPFLDQAAEG